MLPDSMPAQFQSTYTPIAAAGTDSQIKHISRLLATQLTMAGMGKGVGELKLQVSVFPLHRIFCCCFCRGGGSFSSLDAVTVDHSPTCERKQLLVCLTTA